MKTKLPNKTALISAVLLELSTGAQAATIHVDLVNCNLADAITAANSDTATGGCSAGAGADVLDLSSPNGMFVLTAALPVINSEVTINGNGLEVVRNDKADDFTVLSINQGVAVEINDLTISGGSMPNNYGAGLAAGYGATVVVNNSIISGNQGGGVFLLNNVDSQINDSVIENNTGSAAYYYGSGITLIGGALSINNTTISGNVNASNISGGAGIYVTDFLDPVTLNITNSTLSGNTAVVNGGGIDSRGYGVNGIELNLTNVTMTLNSSQGQGGALNTLNSDITISQSLLSGNTASQANQWLSSGNSTATTDYNLFGESGASGVSGVVLGATDFIPYASTNQIMNLTLANNGGPTPTHALVTTGSAVDLVPSAACLLPFDQTGQARPQDGNGDGMADCDVGSVEASSDLIFENGFD